MSKKHTSIIWQLPQEEFQKLVTECETLADILRKFNLHVGAGNYKTLKKRIAEENIDISHIQLGINTNKGRKFPLAALSRTIPLEEILIENSTYTYTTNLKNKLLNLNLLQNKCYICSHEPFWNDKLLMLVIDHINGVSNDNRIENLRILCPNCHSQTDTFSGKNIKLRVIQTTCIDCGKEVGQTTLRCRPCSATFDLYNRKTKIDWPSDSELINMLNETKNFKELSRILGVSDNAIRKRIIKRKLWHLLNKMSDPSQI